MKNVLAISGFILLCGGVGFGVGPAAGVATAGALMLTAGVLAHFYGTGK